MATITIKDDLGDELVLGRLPERIVSLVPSVTETIIDLGCANRLAGITNYCVHPAAAVERIHRVGGTKGFHFERIADLKPDLVIANKEENRKRHVDKLRETYPVFVTYPRTVEQAVKTVLDIGILLAEETRAAEIASACDHVLERFSPSLVGPALPVACMVWRRPWMAVGPDTYMHDLLERTGFRNVFSRDDGRYPETTLDDIIARGAQVVLLPDEPYEFTEVNREEVAEAFRSGGERARILLVDGSYLSWFGTRTLRGLRFMIDTRGRLAGNSQ